MARYVLKYGGTSVASAKRLYAAARTMAALRREGHEVVAVLSAQGTSTDALIARAREIDPDCAGRELDQLLSTGEICSVSPVSYTHLDVYKRQICGSAIRTPETSVQFS